MFLFSYIILALPIILCADTISTKFDCKNLTCPSKEEPVCVKMTYKKGMKIKIFNVIAFNECEVGYIKCHPGFKAAIVSMRNCNHSSQSLNKTQYKQASRIKRQIKKRAKSKRRPRGNYKIAGRINYDYGDRVSSSDEDKASVPHRGKQKLSLKPQASKEVASHEIVNIGNNVPKQSAKEDEDEVENVSNNEIENEQSQEENVDSKGAMIELEAKSTEKTRRPQTSNERNADEIESSKASDETKYKSEERKLGFKDKIEDVPEDYDRIKEVKDVAEYNKDCPSNCPSRDMMLCARCSHGVYRTFMSVCHLRMFTCQHSDEKLTLVSRKPCMQSAPFLSDLKQSSGRISEANDHDTVLQFIICRQKGLLKKGNPKCNCDDV